MGDKLCIGILKCITPKLGKWFIFTQPTSLTLHEWNFLYFISNYALTTVEELM